DQQPLRLEAAPGPDPGAEPSPGRLGELLWSRLPAERVSEDQRFRALSLDPASAPAEPTGLPSPGRAELVSPSQADGLGGDLSYPGQLLAWACGKGIWERRMREIRTSGVTRGERVDESGMRLVRHERGNPDTDLY